MWPADKPLCRLCSEGAKTQPPLAGIVPQELIRPLLGMRIGYIFYAIRPRLTSQDMSAHTRQPLCGLFIGGQARRMGGVAKGLLAAPDTGEPLVARLRRHAESLGLRCVL